MLWWHWVVLGLLLAVGEAVTPGIFVLIFFGVAALVVGGLGFLGLSGPPWVQWLLFSGFSVASLLLFRDPLLRRIGGMNEKSPVVDSLVGELAVALEDIAPGRFGKAELRGSSWSARNQGPTAISRGQRCRVESMQGLELLIRAEGGS